LAAILSPAVGALEVELITMLKPHFSRVRFDGLEPNAAHEKQMHRRLEAVTPAGRSLLECCKTNGVEINLLSSKLEAFRPDVRYDFIVASHVLYYPADKPAAIRALLDLRHPSGTLLVFQQTPAGLNELQRLFAADLRIPPHFYSSLELQTELNSLGIRYHTTLFDQVLDVTDVVSGLSPELSGDEPCDIGLSARGLALLCFLCERELHIQHMDSRERQAILEIRRFIRKISLQRGPKHVLFYPTAAVEVTGDCSQPRLQPSHCASSNGTVSSVRPWRSRRDLNFETVVLRTSVLPDLLRLRAEQDAPSHSLLEFGPRDTSATIVSSRQFYLHTTRTAALLRRASIHSGDRVALLGAPSAEALCLLSALWHNACAVVPLSTTLPVPDLLSQLQVARPKFLVVSEDWAAGHPESLRTLATAGSQWKLAVYGSRLPSPLVPAWAVFSLGSPFAPDEVFSLAVAGGADPAGSNISSAALSADELAHEASVHPDDVCAILFSSGTTSTPKAVPLTHLNLLFTALTRNQPWFDAVNPGLRLLAWMPLCHVMGLVVEWVTTVLYGGGTLLLSAPSATAGQPEHLLREVRLSLANSFCCVPWHLSQFRQLAQTDSSVLPTLRSMRYILYGGAPMPLADVLFLREQGVCLRQGMGMTEVGTLLVAPQDPQAPADELQPLLGFHYFLRPVGAAVTSPAACSAAQEEAEANVGELLVRSLSVTSGYLNRPAGHGFHDGYYCTGDVFRRLQNGRYRFECRVDELLVLPSGEKLNPIPVEEGLRTLAAPFVKTVCVLADEHSPLPLAIVQPDWSQLSGDAPVQESAVYAAIVAAVEQLNTSQPNWARIRRDSLRVLKRTAPPLPVTRKHVPDRRRIREQFLPRLQQDCIVAAAVLAEGMLGAQSEEELGTVPVLSLFLVSLSLSPSLWSR
jgi:long-subunit acyl-CoA synthetase (AMP-forming)